MTKTEWIPRVRWIAIFLFFATSPQYVFRIAGKLLRPVVDAADEAVSIVENLGESD